MDKIVQASTDETKIITTKEVASTIDGAKALSPGDKEAILGMNIEAVPAYNTNKEFHPKGIAIGFIISLEGKKVYFASDTDLIDEMKDIKADVAMLPVGGTYTMNAKEAAEAALLIKPNIAIPMHFGSSVGTVDDAELFKEIVESKSEIKVYVLGYNERITV